ncbi:MAG: 23S rRNA (guanosine(2251)-2'-O)-methyltransferase RlmB [Chlorobi bacterium]|nr:23S rRNA (guanosine(2251)-2'-O)-methyltransferase RlmB [Chlorobiota bacterium]
MDFIYGIRPVEEALEAGRNLEKIYFQNGLQGPLFRTLFTRVRERKIPFQFVPLQRLNRITGKNHQGVIAYLSLVEYQRVENILPALFESGENPFVLMLDRITDVRNIGAIARTADAAGCHALILPEKNSAALNADAMKTSAGALLHIPVCREADLMQTLRFLKNSGLQIVAATEKGEDIFSTLPPAGPVVLIMGSEEKGIRHTLMELTDQQIRIPMFGHVASLNVSVAAGIFIYEILRQRKKE